MADASALTLDAARFDVAVAGLVLNFVQAPQQAIQATANAVKGGGMVAAYVWDYSGKMEIMRHFWDAAAATDPKARGMDR